MKYDDDEALRRARKRIINRETQPGWPIQRAETQNPQPKEIENAAA